MKVGGFNQKGCFFSFPCAGVGMQSRRASVTGSNSKEATMYIHLFISTG